MNNDLISREALKEFINEVCFSKEWAKYRVDYGSRGQIKCILTYIDNAPTVDIKDELAGAYNEGYMCGSREAEKARPQGEWIMQRHDLDGCFYTCSNCGRMIRVPLFIDDTEDNETLADYPFCHCGADMRGKEE